MVPAASEFYVQAKLFEGATHVREYKAKPAVDAFKEVLRIGAESDDPKVKPYEDLANLSLARMFYSTGQYDLAAKYFDRVSTDSYDWANSLFEASWANFMLRQDGYSKALGNIHTLQAPFFDNYIKPESVAEALTVKATIYFYNCQYDRAEDAIDEFRESFEPLFLELKKMVDATTANDQFFELAVKIRKGDFRLPEQDRARRPRRALRPDAGPPLRLREGARPRAGRAREGRHGLEVDQHRQGRLRRPDAAAVAGGERGRRPGAPPHRAA